MVSVAVIGAGAAGLAAARRLLAKNCNVVVFESQKSLGGVWQTTNEDSALYAALRTNLPKEVMAFDVLPFQPCTITSNKSDDTADPQSDETSFVTALDVQTYLLEYARVFNLSSVVRLHTKVMQVVPIERTTNDNNEQPVSLTYVTETVDQSIPITHALSIASAPNIICISCNYCSLIL